MSEIADESIALIVTSPPYWNIKDYGCPEQIGYGQSLEEYYDDLNKVFMECYRVLHPGRRLCVNIGDQFLSAKEYGYHKIVPIHAEIIIMCQKIGFDFMGDIIWQKRSNKRPSGGASIMGSYPYPPNVLVEIDYEHILIFRKPGEYKKPDKNIKEMSRLTKEEYLEYANGHWYIQGERQVEHKAMFPLEIPYRLIKMYSFVGDTVLDPFLGSGTTLKAAMMLDRNGIGYEINKNFLQTIENKIKSADDLFDKNEVKIFIK